MIVQPHVRSESRQIQQCQHISESAIEQREPLDAASSRTTLSGSATNDQRVVVEVHRSGEDVVRTTEEMAEKEATQQSGGTTGVSTKQIETVVSASAQSSSASGKLILPKPTWVTTSVPEDL